jgi:hypothetical protein
LIDGRRKILEQNKVICRYATPSTTSPSEMRSGWPRGLVIGSVVYSYGVFLRGGVHTPPLKPASAGDIDKPNAVVLCNMNQR